MQTTNRELQLSLCHLGYLPDSPKTLTLCPGDAGDALPERIPFYIRQNCFRMPRERDEPKGFSKRFPCPFNLLEGRLIPEPGSYFHQGELVKTTSRWGSFWQADFSAFNTPGSYQIEIDQQISPPFMIADWVYDRLVRGFLTFLESQRCGCDVPGVHPACHLDDGVLDSDGSHWPATGGWHDAGDFRKWLALTQGNLDALVELVSRGPAAFHGQAIEEIAWGNRLFHSMLNEEGRVFEDVAGGGSLPGSGFNYEEHWWFENHPGCYGDAADNRWTDNRPGSGDERLVRTTYNPLVQFRFVANQARCSKVLPGADGARCGALALRAWNYGNRTPHDERTLFIAEQLRAALELRAAGLLPDSSSVRNLCQTLLGRQKTDGDGIRGYFLEKDGSDAYRSIAYTGLPAWSLLCMIELASAEEADLVEKCRHAIQEYCDGYLVADSTSNPFRLGPYGVFLHPEQTELQTFRPAGQGSFVRTFIHPFNSHGLVHGTSSVVADHASVLAKASVLLERSDWADLAEKQIQWILGHNTLNRSLVTGIGYRQPVGYGFRVTQIPEATVAGFIGRPDDTPYLEESFAIEWSTLEYWDVPYAHLATAIPWLRK